ncbi:BLUF domain-containing protein [Gillisia sp. CAL575]|uniref:BLUF domain-containing protein n=1 Tax=Gillisia sp. CAL575 TaxID=985255 RepID=UPI0003A52BCF|nr:BLUF domain-containing protein [Gillisia sp. CAL575]
MKQTHTICYVSKANPNLTIEEINEIFKLTEENNRLNHVRGILLHSLGNFFQVLEGEEKYIEDLYENKILIDSRHSEVFEVYRRNVTKPVFQNYFSQFQAITTSSQLDKVRKYLELNKRDSISEKLSRLLNPFIIWD